MRALLGLLTLAPLLTHAAFVNGLMARDYDQDGTVDAYYETSANLTWQARISDVRMDYPEATSFLANLQLGGGGWRLPHQVRDVADGCDIDGLVLCGPVANPQTSELAHLLNVTLGGEESLAGSPFVSRSNFPMVWTDGAEGVIWYANRLYPWHQASCGDNPLCYRFQVWAVRDGDAVSAIPEPETYALMLVGLIAGAVALRRRGGCSC